MRAAQQETVNNAAALPLTLPYQPLGWTPITMFVDPAKDETTILFGNEVAEAAAKDPSPGQGNATNRSYPEGSVLALVTWKQREDPHWFGARIPSDPQSVEFLVIGLNHAVSYSLFQGRPLSATAAGTSVSANRTNYILGLAPARFPR